MHSGCSNMLQTNTEVLYWSLWILGPVLVLLVNCQLESCEVAAKPCSCENVHGNLTIRCRLGRNETANITLQNITNVVHLDVAGENFFPHLQEQRNLCENLSVLILSNNEEETVLRNDTMLNCRNLVLFRVHKYSLVGIEAGALREMNKLKELDLSDNSNLLYPDVMRAIGETALPFLETFNISGIHNAAALSLLTVEHGSFKPLLNTNLKVLDASWTRLVIFNASIMFVPGLRHLDLSGTLVAGTYECLSAVLGLEELHTGVLQHWPSLARGHESVLRHETLSYRRKREVQENHACQLHGVRTAEYCLILPPKLQILDFRYSDADSAYIDFKSELCFSNNSLRHFSLSYARFSSPLGNLKGLHKLEVFEFSHPDTSQLKSKLSVVSDEFFFDMPLLKIVIVSGLLLNRIPLNKFDTLFSRNHELQIIDISQNSLPSLPRKFLNHNPKLEILNASWNNIDYFITDMSGNSALKVIDLRYNQIKTIADYVLPGLLNHTSEIVIYTSIDVCKMWYCIIQPESTLPIHMNCTQNESYITIHGNNSTTNGTQLWCESGVAKDHGVSVLAIVLPVCLVLVCAIVIILCIRRHRMQNYRKNGSLSSDTNISGTLEIESVENVVENSNNTSVIYLRKAGPSRNSSNTRQFACFLAYSYSDANFVITKIYEPLQQKLQKILSDRNPFTLVIIHDKNFMPGEPLTDIIKQAVAESCVTIAAVSDDFVNSLWCNREVLFAVESDTPIIPVYLKSCDPTKLTGVLRDIYDSKVRLKWPDGTAMSEDEMSQEENYVIDVLCKTVLRNIGPFLNDVSSDGRHDKVPFVGANGVFYEPLISTTRL